MSIDNAKEKNNVVLFKKPETDKLGMIGGVMGLTVTDQKGEIVHRSEPKGNAE